MGVSIHAVSIFSVIARTASDAGVLPTSKWRWHRQSRLLLHDASIFVWARANHRVICQMDSQVRGGWLIRIRFGINQAAIVIEVDHSESRYGYDLAYTWSPDQALSTEFCQFNPPRRKPQQAKMLMLNSPIGWCRIES